MNIERPKRESSEQMIMSPFCVFAINFPKFLFLGDIVPLIVYSIQQSIFMFCFSQNFVISNR